MRKHVVYTYTGRYDNDEDDDDNDDDVDDDNVNAILQCAWIYLKHNYIFN